MIMPTFRLAVVRAAASAIRPVATNHHHISPSKTTTTSLNYSSGRASIRDLQRLLDDIPSITLPMHLSSMLVEAARDEDMSALSTDAHDDVVRDMASFMSSTIASYGEKFESEGIYNPELLAVYDALVWGFNSPFLWRITPEDVTSLYRANVSRKHCEIAVGTGLHLSKVIPLTREITLIDLNENCLRVCEERITNDHHKGDCDVAKPEVSKLVVDITEPPSPPPGKDAGHYSQLTPIRGQFQSVGVNFLFHCLHGSNLYNKVDAFRNCASLLDPEDGVFFGSTILGKEILDDEDNAGETTIRTLRALNSMGVFGNLGDSLIDLDRILRDLFDDVVVRRVGYCGIWKATHRRV